MRVRLKRATCTGFGRRVARALDGNYNELTLGISPVFSGLRELRPARVHPHCLPTVAEGPYVPFEHKTIPMPPEV